MRKFAFAPIIDAATRVLILGSLPGEASLAAGRYYAHPRNQFWHLAGALVGRDDLAALEYDQRLAVLLESGIGLWDTVASAHRPGSLDSAIRDADHAPLRDLVSLLPQLRAIGFNGKTSARIGRRQLAGHGLELCDLPSSSPAHAVMTLDAKRAHWLALKQFLA